ncbi:MAG: hypothetical protein GWM92_16405, partial [Gemmatimonadetes bacterium]|nr:hypothetical protein [Gemmatimonadota bacterium]NIR80338.1 hypothetical protein [Gemmatimonadota bacterium]NIT89101.1 hypothetical protein [Gemmatimonadota bacterium]NIU32898.1 hypothetical protein [Gemmatimonadota bacterium]NIU37297.1 hypothetical protein [Gemmatimonadota bacterium]
ESEGRVFFDELVRRARALPGVGDAALARGITRGGPTLRLRAPDGGETVRVETNVIGPGYLDLMGIPVVE